MSYYVGDLPNTSTTIATGTGTSDTTYWTGGTSVSGWCPSCTVWWFGGHHCHNHCGSDEHDYAQAASPYEATLFCRHCGETKQLTKKGTAK